eukprot:TRINITY_DN4190_c0_g1_i8.p4 TRINITY_DN4190_c0_g1~~TRINITY_DN4190_c0_g1_i8.p4  ORF type:complete len:106 (-),score=5.29 TRINITY_DN4190_c0_g1_i8:424-741(-)
MAFASHRGMAPDASGTPLSHPDDEDMPHLSYAARRQATKLVKLDIVQRNPYRDLHRPTDVPTEGCLKASWSPGEPSATMEDNLVARANLLPIASSRTVAQHKTRT